MSATGKLEHTTDPDTRRAGFGVERLLHVLGKRCLKAS
jgi:hypothetical protein